ncbi:MAG: hypothetical protein EPO65_07005 [Dehalococcoidia bacterium]|nr:MAG: hypothetical protein EPO65_07005 [Dehalococcoidia bacterium]
MAGYWKRIVGLAGFQEHVEPPAPRFPTDEALKAELHKWLQVPEHGVKDVATKDERVSFAIEVTDPQKRIVTFSKLKDAPVLAVSARATASDTSAPTVAGMDNLAYRSMQGDIGIELARAGVSFDARWIVKGRDDPKNAESDDQPGIGFQRNIVVNDNLTAEMVLREHNLLVRLLIVVIVVMNKYVRQEEARLGNVNTPLAVIPPSEITTETGR